MSRIELICEGTIYPDQEESHLYISVSMPADAIRVDVSFSYGEPICAGPFLSGGNALDISILDERGIDFPGCEFRVRCGSERAAFSTAAETWCPPVSSRTRVSRGKTELQ